MRARDVKPKSSDAPRTTGRNADPFRSLFDCSPNPTMLCNRDVVIQYANPIAIKTLERLEQYLPVKANQIVGSSIEIFHRDATHLRGLLGDPRNLPHTERIAIGPQTLELKAFAIIDHAGNYAGPALSWEIITERVAVEKRAAKDQAEIARVRSVIENSPNPTMLCDLDLTIVYANAAAHAALQRIAHLLPIKASQIVGSSIDIFYKDSTHQRGMLSDPRNLPHRARVTLGTETLELNVHATFDAAN